MYTRRNLATGLVLAISMVGISYGVGGDMGAATEPWTDGSAAYPYLIEDLTDFDVFADQANAATYWAGGVYTKLSCDPNLTGRPYTTAVIAPDTPGTNWPFDGIPFEGVFDGNDCVIRNLTIDTAGADNHSLGLFGRIEGSSAKIKNLGIENVNITSGDDSDCLGGLCGWNYHVTITNCYATGSVTGGDDLGGLCGRNNGIITNCYATGLVTGGDSSIHLGGLCGWNYEGTITNCYAAGSVTGGAGSYYLGGLCGYNYQGTITDCYATGSVTGVDYSWNLGGLCGANGYNGTIGNCYATSLVTGGDYSWNLGGLCGVHNHYGAITNCYFHLLGGPDNGLGTALDDLEMQDAAGFAGFDFAGNSNDGENDYWTIVSGYCPKLTWQTDDGPQVPTPPVTTLSGSGYSYDPFRITSYVDFTEFRTNSGLRCGYYILTADIDLYGDTFTTAVINGYFGGHFDGNGHVIRNITIDTAGADNGCLSLFSRIFASVSNLGIENINITGGDGSYYLGGLCGHNRGGTIINCYATGSVTSGYYSHCLGGLCGYNDDDGTIINCYAASSVTGGNDSDDLGGLCGCNRNGTITNCYAAGSVTGGDASRYLGGLCGYNYYYGTITNCYAAGAITGGDTSRCLGGLCGYNYGTITNCYAADWVTGGDDSWNLGGLCGENDGGIITNCYATGSVTGWTNSGQLGGLCGCNRNGTITNCYATGALTGGDDSYDLGGLCGMNYYSTITNCYATGSVTGGDGSRWLRGLCGYNYDGTISDCFWDVETSGIGSAGDDNYGATGKTTVQMQTESTFTDASWDFFGEDINGTDDFWDICEGTNYPKLSWQFLAGDFLCPDGVDLRDFAVLAETWSLSSGQIGYNNLCDLIDDDTIDLNDLAVFAENWLCD